MDPPNYFQQVSLAVAIMASITISYIALSPPNPTTSTTPVTGDFLRHIGMANKHATKIVLAPLCLLAIHTSNLALNAPDIPPRLLGYGAENGLNLDLITWSASTSIPIILLLFFGAPLRLIAYTSLGSNFTFGLREPDRLTTTGVYRYVQHPSYTGVFLIQTSIIALFVRFDGVLSCWIPPFVFPFIRGLWFISVPVVLGFGIFGLGMRVRQEEQMLRNKFGRKWEEWHAKTPRFLPWLI